MNMLNAMKKYWLKYACGCSEKILCSEMQARSWKALVGSSKTFCGKHKITAALIGFDPRKEGHNAR